MLHIPFIDWHCFVLIQKKCLVNHKCHLTSINLNIFHSALFSKLFSFPVSRLFWLASLPNPDNHFMSDSHGHCSNFQLYICFFSNYSEVELTLLWFIQEMWASKSRPAFTCPFLIAHGRCGELPCWTSVVPDMWVYHYIAGEGGSGFWPSDGEGRTI